MTTVAFRGVELARAGKWDAAQGDGTITREDIAAMVTAHSAQLIDRVPIKIGHSDLRFQDAHGQPPVTGDGSPAYGWVTGLRASPDGATLIGDLVGVPSKLAAMLPTAFRHRSIEMQTGRRIGGKVHRAILSGLALLGVNPPAVKGLADLAALFGQQQPVHFAAGPARDAQDDGDARAMATYVRPGRTPARAVFAAADPDDARALATYVR